MPAMKVSFKASAEELRELCDLIRSSFTEQLVAIGVALGCSEVALRSAIPLADGIRQVAERLRKSNSFYVDAAVRAAPVLIEAERMRPVVEAARDCTCLCNCGSLNALKMAVAAYEAYEEVSKTDDSSTSPSAEGSTTSPSNAGDSNAPPSSPIAWSCAQAESCPECQGRLSEYPCPRCGRVDHRFTAG